MYAYKQHCNVISGNDSALSEHNNKCEKSKYTLMNMGVTNSQILILEYKDTKKTKIYCIIIQKDVLRVIKYLDLYIMNIYNEYTNI